MLPSPALERPLVKPLYHPESENGEDTPLNDIYRGQSSSRHSSHPESSIAISISSSSSSWSFFNGRLGAFTNLVSTLEAAISGWRDSSSDSSSSIATMTRSSKRQKSRGSSADLKRQQSERDFSAHISLIKAREESRIIPRQFSLYLAPSLRPVGNQASQPVGDIDSPNSQGVLWTSSLDSVLNQLDAALKKTTRAKRREKDHPLSRSSPGDTHQNIMLPENLKAPSRAASFTDLPALRKVKKGKAKDGAEIAPDVAKTMQIHNPWFLDISSPTSEDMRAIGKLLHLHPLTLEDILQQDPREKIERFPKLGYYFISFRTIESRTARAKLECQLANTSGDEGLLVESNVYMVVFNEGQFYQRNASGFYSLAKQFHFMDASEHIDRVRHRIISLEKSINMSSAWIAHSLLDSIVDSFFPFSDEIEREVMAIEQLVYSDNTIADTSDIPINAEPPRNAHDSEKESLPPLNEKNLTKLDRTFTTRTRFAITRPPLPLLYRRFLRYLRSRWQGSPAAADKSTPSSRMITLRRMARTRKLVTSLARLLATKSDVVAQIRKRLLTESENRKASRSEELEVAMYMGDVQDHILTLQHALEHYERMLSQSHPTYLHQLRNNTSLSTSGADKALLYLTTVSMAVLSLQTIIGMFSLNINVPESPNSFHVFGYIVAIDILVFIAFLGLVRRWWVNAKKRRSNILGRP
ncbi:hypothetical protein BDP27DRAFT_1414761 [Rhodocollybia butyracea]|uniref:Metal ion transporter n=1 Tax=Rhodocollybia butyracea TaxID=206335 RepID=A0A9P5Q0U3_9AGAR|nr:hypothetical protein BDP27DRAFT_1414761 [Rhodocollybia butyracea]